MRDVSIGRITIHGAAGKSRAAAEQQARQIARILANTVAEGDAEVPRGKISLKVSGAHSLTAERIAHLAALQLKRRLS